MNLCIQYIILFFKFYPYIYYLIILYDLCGYLIFVKNIYSFFYKKLRPIKQRHIDEIYEVVLQKEPTETFIDDDTCYLSFYSNENDLYENWFIL